MQRRQLCESRDVGAQLGHRDVFDILEQTGLMVEQEQNRIRRIQQCFATAGFMFDPVVNRVFAIGLEDGWISSSHSFPFCLGVFLFTVLVSDPMPALRRENAITVPRREVKEFCEPVGSKAWG
jgi:hypothetical protein